MIGWTVAAIAGFCVLVWWGISLFYGRLTGWSTLGRAYRAHRPLPTQRWRHQSAAVRWMLTSYRHGVTFGADGEGLYMSVMFLLRPGHPALFIPWSDVEVHGGRFLRSKFVRFRFRGFPFIPVTVTERLARCLAEAAGDCWPQAQREAP